MIQYSATSVIELERRGILDARRSLTSGAHSRDPVAGMTCGGARPQATSVSLGMLASTERLRPWALAA